MSKACLRQCFVEFDGPMGNVGDVLWLCQDHADLLERQNKNTLEKFHENSDVTKFWTDDLDDSKGLVPLIWCL